MVVWDRASFRRCSCGGCQAVVLGLDPRQRHDDSKTVVGGYADRPFAVRGDDCL